MKLTEWYYDSALTVPLGFVALQQSYSRSVMHVCCIQWMTNVICMAWESSSVPDDWKRQVIMTSYKLEGASPISIELNWHGHGWRHSTVTAFLYQPADQNLTLQCLRMYGADTWIVTIASIVHVSTRSINSAVAVHCVFRMQPMSVFCNKVSKTQD